MHVILLAPPIMDFEGGMRRSGPLQPIAMDAVRECPPYGIYLLAAVLRAAGHDVTLIDLIAYGTFETTPWQEAFDKADLVGIGATSMSWPTAWAAIKDFRSRGCRAPIVLGGIHPTMFDEYLLKAFPIHFVIRGEGEIGLVALCEAIEGRRAFEDVPNLSWKDESGAVRRASLGPKIDKRHLADFPLPDYAEVPAGIYKGLAIESSRGCAFDCSFCSTSYRKTYRGMAPEQFVDRLEGVMAHLGRTLYQTIHIIDDEFSMNPRRATEIAQTIRKRGLKPQLVFDSRATDLITDGYVENIAEFTTQFLVGAECGYDEGLKKIGKGTTCAILEAAALKLACNGISDKADFSFILGLPWESRAEIEQTIRFAMGLHANYGVRVLLQWYCQIPGSRLWDADRASGVVNESMYNEFGFFRDHYLFRSGVRLSPDEIWDIADTVEQLKFLASLRLPRRRMIEFAFPQAIWDFYPRAVMSSARTGLDSLREVARPQATEATLATGQARHEMVEAGIPQRHFVGYQ